MTSKKAPSGSQAVWLEHLYACFPAKFTDLIDALGNSLDVSLNYRSGNRVTRIMNCFSENSIPPVAHGRLSSRYVDCIMHTSLLDVIDKWDKSDVLFYCDTLRPLPGRELTDADQHQLAGRLQRIEGFALVHGRDCLLMNKLYRDWYKIRLLVEPGQFLANTDGVIQECVWLNYKPTSMESPCPATKIS